MTNNFGHFINLIVWYIFCFARLVPRPGPLIHGGDVDANVNSYSSRATIPNGGISQSAFYRSRGNGDILSNEASYILTQ